MSALGYSEEDIQTISGPDAIRLRPGMYIGSRDTNGLHVLIGELLTNSLDEVKAGFGRQIGVTLFADGSCAVEDDGRGIGIHGVGLIASLTTGHRSATGLHGLGLKVVTALSEWGEVRTEFDARRQTVRFRRGVVTSPTTIEDGASDRTGTAVRFKPDPEIFGNHTFDLRQLLHRLCELAFLHTGVRFTFTDERTGKTDTFRFADGLTEFVKHLNTGEETLHEPIRLSGERDGVGIEAAFQVVRGNEIVEQSYVNGNCSPGGGSHVRGFRRGWCQALRTFASRAGLLPLERLRVGTRWLRGMRMVLDLSHPDPRWEGATKDALMSTDAELAAAAVVQNQLTRHLEAQPQVGRALWERAIRSAKETEEAIRVRTHRRVAST